MYNIQNPPVNFENAIKGASFLARNCNSASGREGLVRELIRHTFDKKFKIDSLSSCLRNARPPEGVDLNNKTDVMKEYLFHFSFENQQTTDYITEKLWEALASGTLPVYFGAPNIREHIPSNSVILVEDFSSAEELISHLLLLSQNRTLYNAYHEWRYKPLPKLFREKYNFTQVHSYCRICRFAYAVKYGWGWDRTQQEVRPLRIPRGNTCLDESGWMASPIKESWIGKEGQESSDLIKFSKTQKIEHLLTKDKCVVERKSERRIPGTSWTRTVWDHDGVTDIEISSSRIKDYDEQMTFMRLEMPIQTDRAISFRNQLDHWRKIYWIQDDRSRIVIVFNETTLLTETLEFPGTFDIPITNPLRIRLIVEDIDFHDGGYENENYFGSLMTDEFFAPLEISVHIK
jgi:hypothetical protein